MIPNPDGYVIMMRIIIVIIMWLFKCLIRTATARGKAEQADISAVNAREDSEVARVIARELAPDFLQPGKWHYFIRAFFSVYIHLINGKIVINLKYQKEIHLI